MAIIELKTGSVGVNPIEIQTNVRPNEEAVTGALIGVNSDLDQTNLALLLTSTDAIVPNNSTSSIYMYTGDTLSGNGSTGQMQISTGTVNDAAGTGNTGDLFIGTGYAANGHSGTITINPGSSYGSAAGAPGQLNLTGAGVFSGSWTGQAGSISLTAGQSNVGGHGGDINIATGTGAVRGVIRLQNGSEGTLGWVWTETAADGTGAWVTAAANLQPNISTVVDDTPASSNYQWPWYTGAPGGVGNFIAEQIIPGSTYDLYQVKVRATVGTGFSNTITAQVLIDNATSPGAVIATSNTLNLTGQFNSLATLTFAEPVTLKSGVPYWIKFFPTTVANDGAGVMGHPGGIAQHLVGQQPNNINFPNTGASIDMALYTPAGYDIGSSVFHFDTAYLEAVNSGVQPSGVQTTANFISGSNKITNIANMTGIFPGMVASSTAGSISSAFAFVSAIDVPNSTIYLEIGITAGATATGGDLTLTVPAGFMKSISLNGGLKQGDFAPYFWSGPAYTLLGDSDTDPTGATATVLGTSDTGLAATVTNPLILQSGAQLNPSATTATGDVDLATGDTWGSSGSTGGISLLTGTSQTSGSTATSGSISIATGSAMAGASGGVTIGSGTTVNGNTGSVIISTGVPGTGTRGSIVFQNGTEGKAGYVWTSSDTGGTGQWEVRGGSTITAVGSGATTLTTAEYKILLTLTTGTATITLPQGVEGASYRFGYTAAAVSGSGTVALSPNAGDTIDGSVTSAIATPHAGTVDITFHSGTWYLL